MLRLKWPALQLLFAVYLLHPNIAHSEERIALVVGNSAYQNVAPLANPANDARLIGDTLRDLGFEIISAGSNLDLDRASFEKAIRAFARRLASTDAVGLFYYAGHAIEYRGRNYLIPVDASIEGEGDVSFELIDVNLVLHQMELAGNPLNMVILDSCRNNPFAGRGLRAIGRGLGRLDAPAGTIISYATRPGDVAADGSGVNSPFTTALAKAFRLPNRDVLDMFNRVGVMVSAATKGVQEPWLSSSPIEGRFLFNPIKAEAPAVSSSPAAAAPASGGRNERLDVELAYWESVKNSTEPLEFEAYLTQFPNGNFTTLARLKLKRLRAVGKQPEPQKQPVAVAPISRVPAVESAGGMEGRWSVSIQFVSPQEGIRVGRFEGDFDVSSGVFETEMYNKMGGGQLWLKGLYERGQLRVEGTAMFDRYPTKFFVATMDREDAGFEIEANTGDRLGSYAGFAYTLAIRPK